jgi:hypothetical protein
MSRKASLVEFSLDGEGFAHIITQASIFGLMQVKMSVSIYWGAIAIGWA